jgi:DNA-binding NarL/FixJ family response regulator
MKLQVSAIRRAIKGLKPSDVVEIADGKLTPVPAPQREKLKRGPKPGSGRTFSYEMAASMVADGVSQREIAKRLGVTPQAISVALKRSQEVEP